MAETATAKAPKWDEKTVEILRTEYVPGNQASVDRLVEKLNRTNRQVIGKLVNMGVYVAPEKPAKQARDEGPTKAEILEKIAATGFDTTGFENAKKDALFRLQDLVTQ